jgi:hypothetical protein
MNQKSSHASFNFQNLYKHEITKIKSSIFSKINTLNAFKHTQKRRRRRRRIIKNPMKINLLKCYKNFKIHKQKPKKKIQNIELITKEKHPSPSKPLTIPKTLTM